MKKKSNFAGARAWKDEFPFLAKTGLDQLYQMILGMAGSKNDIRRFHNLLGANMRLLRPDLIKLENYWEKYIFSGKKIIYKQIGHSDETLKWLFAAQCSGKNNSKYYVDYLNFKTVSILPFFQLSDNRLVVSTEGRVSFCERFGLCFVHFYADIFNASFWVECFAPNDGGSITACFIIEEDFLTEELTYQLSQMPGYITQGTFSHFGNTSYLVVNVPFDRKNELLKEYSSENFPGGSYYLANDGFVSYLKDKLIESGIPLTGLYPFLV